MYPLIEIKSIKKKLFLIEFEIEEKFYEHFRTDYKTRKWISLDNWYQIDRKLEVEIAKYTNNMNEIKKLETSFEINSLKLTVSLKDLDDCYFKLEKNSRNLDHLLKVKIIDKNAENNDPEPAPTMSEYEKIKAKYDSDEYNPTTCVPVIKYEPQSKSRKPESTAASEYVPIDMLSKENKSGNSNTYIPSIKQEKSNGQEDEYSPIPCSSSNSRSAHYIPTKISPGSENSSKSKDPRNKRTNKLKNLFGSDDEEEIPATPPSSQQDDMVQGSQSDEEIGHRKKPRLERNCRLRRENEKEKDKEKEHRKRETSVKGKKVKDKQQDAPARPIDCHPFFTRDKKFNKTVMEAVPPRGNSYECLTDEEVRERQRKQHEIFMSKYEEFKKVMDEENAAEEEIQERLRIMELIDCQTFSNEQILEEMDEFADLIKTKIKLYRSMKYISKPKDYSPLDLTSSKIFTEEQIMFLLTELEKKFLKPEEHGMCGDLLLDDIVPELMLNIFMKQFDFDRVEAIQRIKDQEKKRMLLNKSFD